jgi:hypothetical protein
VSATTRTPTSSAQDFVGDPVGDRDEINGYVFWGLVALFIGVPELLAAFSKTLKAEIPWPTISNLVGKDLERRYHWVALLVVGGIVVVTVHTLTYPAKKKKAGRAVRDPSEAVHVPWSGWYIVLVAAAGAAAGVIASALGANKNELGYAIYLTLVVAGIVIPSALAYWWNRVLSIPDALRNDCAAPDARFVGRRARRGAARRSALPPRALSVAELPVRRAVTGRARGTGTARRAASFGSARGSRQQAAPLPGERHPTVRAHPRHGRRRR